MCIEPRQWAAIIERSRTCGAGKHDFQETQGIKWGLCMRGCGADAAAINAKDFDTLNAEADIVIREKYRPLVEQRKAEDEWCEEQRIKRRNEAFEAVHAVLAAYREDCYELRFHYPDSKLYSFERNSLADECQRLADENKRLSAEVGALTLKLNRLEKRK